MTTAPVGSAVSIDDARRQVRIDADDTDNVSKLAIALAGALAHVSRYTGTFLAACTVRARCDSFADFEHLDFGPVQSISSISYLDASGASQTLSPSAYELLASGIEAAIVPAFNGNWPSAAARAGAVTIEAVAGYAVLPDNIRASVLLLTHDLFDGRANAEQPDMTVFDTLLVNDRL